MKSIIKSAIVFALMLLPVLSFGQDKATNFVENEFIIWLEQGVDAATFSANSNVGISPKRMLSKRLNIWLFEITDKAESREVKMERLWKHPDVRVIQNNHTNITLREAIPDDPYFGQQWAPAIMSLPQAWDEFTTGGITATGDASMTTATAMWMTIVAGMPTTTMEMSVPTTTAPMFQASSGRLATMERAFVA